MYTINVYICIHCNVHNKCAHLFVTKHIIVNIIVNIFSGEKMGFGLDISAKHFNQSKYN